MSNNTTNTTPPGWYPDPSPNGNGQRYWDGSTWTEHTAPAGQAPQGGLGQAPSPSGTGQPTTAMPAPQGPDKKNWFLRHKIPTGILALVLIVIIVQAAGGGNDAPANTATDQGNTSTDNSSDKSTASDGSN